MFWFILFLILLYFILSPIIRVWRKVHQFRDEYEQAMKQQGSYQPSDGKTAEEREMVERYRRYSEENAENVDFEELEGPMPNEQQEHEPPQSTSRYQEEEVSDAEYEDI